MRRNHDRGTGEWVFVGMSTSPHIPTVDRGRADSSVAVPAETARVDSQLEDSERNGAPGAKCAPAGGCFQRDASCHVHSGKRGEREQINVDVVGGQVGRFPARKALGEGEGRQRSEDEPGDGRDRAERKDAARPRDHGATPVPREGIQQDKTAEDGQDLEERVQSGDKAIAVDDPPQGEGRPHPWAESRKEVA